MIQFLILYLGKVSLTLHIPMCKGVAPCRKNRGIAFIVLFRYKNTDIRLWRVVTGLVVRGATEKGEEGIQIKTENGSRVILTTKPAPR